MAWYRTGTASFTNGSTAVTGAGTTWIGNIAAGEALLGPDGRLYEIAAIVSSTSLTLGSTYLGATAATQPYVIAPTQSYLRDLAGSAASLVSTYSASLAALTNGRFGNGAVATPGITFNLDQDTGFWNKAANTLAVSTGGVERAVFDSVGALGLGVSAPAEALHVSKAQAGATLIRVQNDTAGATAYGGYSVYHGATNKLQMLHMSTAYTTANQFVADGSVVNGGGVGGVSIAAANAAGDVRFYSGGVTERMRLSAAGNFGIGRTPTTKLDVNGSIALSSPTAVAVGTYTVLATDSTVRPTVACSLTLPAAASFPGRVLTICNVGAFAITSATANVCPIGSNTAGTAILAATSGKFAQLQSNGTSWITLMAN